MIADILPRIGVPSTESAHQRFVKLRLKQIQRQVIGGVPKGVFELPRNLIQTYECHHRQEVEHKSCPKLRKRYIQSGEYEHRHHHIERRNLFVHERKRNVRHLPRRMYHNIPSLVYCCNLEMMGGPTFPIPPLRCSRIVNSLSHMVQRATLAQGPFIFRSMSTSASLTPPMTLKGRAASKDSRLVWDRDVSKRNRKIS